MMHYKDNFAHLLIKESHSENKPVLMECFQIAKYASMHESVQLFFDAMDFIRDESQKYFKKHLNDGDEETAFFRQYNDVLDEIRKQLSKKDSGFFESYEQLVPIYFGERHFYEVDTLSYSKMWKTLDIVVLNHKDEYFKKYWRTAEMYYLNNVDDNCEALNNRDRNAIDTFREFHFMLGVMLTYRKQWELLSQILMPVEVERNETYLVPTQITSLLKIAQSLLNQNAPGHGLSSFYMMKGMEEYRYIDELLTNAIFAYTSLLFIRLWLVGQYYHRDPKTFDNPNYEDLTVPDLYKCLYALNRLKSEVENWHEPDSLAILRQLVPDDMPLSGIVGKIEDIRKAIIAKIRTHNTSDGTSDQKIDILKNMLKVELKEKDGILPTENNDLINEDNKDILHAYYGTIIDKRDIDKQSNGDPSKLAAKVINRLLLQLCSSYTLKIEKETPQYKYNIYIKEFYESLRLLGVDSTCVVFLSYLSPEFIAKHYASSELLKKAEDGRYYFNEAPIWSLPFDYKYRAIVISKKVLPYVEVIPADKGEGNLVEIDSELNLLSNADTLSANDEQHRLLKVARNYWIHTSKDPLSYIELEFIMKGDVASDINSIKPMIKK